ncbi:unnamed protein product [Aureobasidium vineae]|uniref:t-SNARE coiled-coil homology domain-containing protein n=1 Tax=Aureobasidium vineae TaxID=2773715 RepID=A0A9N8JEM1_9PEZI|nr:unnamed protein product [Aureobasidium vineae]
MANPMDSDAGSELFNNYEAELKLVQADLNQKLDQLPELAGEERKAAIGRAQRSLEEATEIENLPANQKTKTNQRFRNYTHDIDMAKQKLKGLSSDKSALFGRRYTDNPTSDDQLEQRQQLLSGTDRLDRSSGRLRESQRIALETEDIGRNTLADLARQREVIEHSRDVLLEGEGYTDRSNKTLKQMARRMATNKIITIAIITVLVLLILAVIISKFR